MKPHAFVVMPFGEKPDKKGKIINFNAVYCDYIKPALEDAGLEVFRADEELRAGDIHTDMFQELLIADLVVADLTIDNPNVWYELGVRHALRARGVVLVCGGRVTSAFDLYTSRKLRYGIQEGIPDPDSLEADKNNLTTMVKETMESWHGRKISPVYNLMPNLQEPDWKSLRIGDAREFWQRYESWEERILLARKAMRIGDVLVLADEAPVAALRAESWIRAGTALRKAERFDIALEQLDRGLAVEPDNMKGLQEKGMCLQRLAKLGKSNYSLERAREHYRKLIRNYDNDAEIWALLARVEKDAWVDSWRIPGTDKAEMQEEAREEDALLRAAIEAYLRAYQLNPAHYYSGINALVLMHLYQYLTEDSRYDEDMKPLAGAVAFAAANENQEYAGFWALSSLADLEVLTGKPKKVKSAYKEAVARNRRDWFALNSCREQLLLLKDLDFKPENVNEGLAVFDRTLRKLKRPAEQWQPKRVFLFSGHMVDAPDRAEPRFPEDKVPVATEKIAELLERLDVDADDLALTQGACGGDILFTQVFQQRGGRVHWLQPFVEPEFIQKSVDRGGQDWVQRYYDAKQRLAAEIRAAPDALGEPPDAENRGYAYERCNMWLLYTALAYGLDKVNLICLWNGGGGDGPGGTAYMYDAVKARTGRVYQIDSRTL